MTGFHISASGMIQGHHGPLVMWLQYKSFEKTDGKGEIACHEQFLLFQMGEQSWEFKPQDGLESIINLQTVKEMKQTLD